MLKICLDDILVHLGDFFINVDHEGGHIYMLRSYAVYSLLQQKKSITGIARP